MPAGSRKFDATIRTIILIAFVGAAIAEALGLRIFGNPMLDSVFLTLGNLLFVAAGIIFALGAISGLGTDADPFSSIFALALAICSLAVAGQGFDGLIHQTASLLHLSYYRTEALFVAIIAVAIIIFAVEVYPMYLKMERELAIAIQERAIVYEE